ncbi:Actin- protein 6 [Dermatophagoides pteronyssinus]|uniref:Actin- protein 6 n=1 Tax=Dermatophagoides pteronyssinus TaxID=6956 RepID=A0ABQ8IQ06_DERPT|nr:Actin- protein 6 [Dermatophagoides pteronyssinus]
MANDQINQIVIIDNGAHTMKVGLHTDTIPRIIPNCITKVKNEKRRPFIGDQMEECKDYSGMFYILPFNRGYLINWDIQRQIWDYVFRIVLKLQPDNKNRYSHTGILITEPVYNFPEIRQTMIRILFEEYGFGKVLITSAPQLAAFHYENDKDIEKNTSKCRTDPSCCLVLDSGYSFSHIVPFVDGHKLLTHTKRVNVGGKALTNHLKEILSYRQINVLDETYVVNQMKEDCCFVSMDFWHDLELASKKSGKDNPIVRDYILPDYIVYKRGFVYDPIKHNDINTSDYQLIRMNNERFQVPEILFHPSDINMDQIGIVETIIYSLNEFHPAFRLMSSKQAIDNGGNNGSNDTINTGSGGGGRERPENLKDIDSEEEDEEDEEEVADDDDDNDDDQDGEVEKDNNGNEKKEENGRDGNVRPSDAKQPRLSQVQYTNGSNEQSMNGLEMYDDENIRARLYANILLIGGNCRFANFRDRVYNDLRGFVPDLIDIHVYQPSNPITYAWQGGRILCHQNEGLKNNNNKIKNNNDHHQSVYDRYAISRQQYQQYGLNYCLEKLTNHRLIGNQFNQ